MTAADGLEATEALRAIAERLRSFARRNSVRLVPAGVNPDEAPELAAALGEPIESFSITTMNRVIETIATHSTTGVSS